MRKKFLLITTIALLAVACKKEAKEIVNSQSPESTTSEFMASSNLSICTGNTWTFDQATPATESDPTLVYNNKAYVFGSTDLNHISIFDGTAWTTIPTLSPFELSTPDIYFTIGNKGYLGFGNIATQGFWEYDFETNTWTQKASFPGPPRIRSAAFTIGTKGYVVGGEHLLNGNYLNYRDTWEYDQANNVWTQKASFPALVLGRFGSTGFTIGNLGYIVNGGHRTAAEKNTPQLFNSLMQYDPVTNAWTFKAHFPGEGRYNSKAFIISGLVYVGVGMINGNSSYDDFYKYYPASDTWLAVPDFPGIGHYRTISFAINSKGYIAYDYINNPHDLRLVKYTPLICPIGNPGPQ